MRAVLLFSVLVFALASALLAAQSGAPPVSSRIASALPGDGAFDAPVPPVGAPGGPSRVLNAVELDRWKRGRALFDHDFHRADGLGTPEFNADSCRACHQDPQIGGAGGLELNVSRFGRDFGSSTTFTDLPGGQAASRLRPPYVLAREEIDATADVFEQRQTPSLFGAGLIDSISDAEILSNEDPTDTDSDGVFGVARIVDAGGSLEVGRFGWRAQVPRVTDFVRDAMAGECGITTPDDGRGFALVADADAVPDPELTVEQVDDLAFFLSNLAPPARGGSQSALVVQGEQLFETIGCATCHIPTLQGAQGPVNLFSDLLLHDVSPAGFRGMAEAGAPVGFYRTPPLWGNCETAPYMHDGAAETVEAAIEMHFGEADAARVAFAGLTQQEKEALLAFLADL